MRIAPDQPWPRAAMLHRHVREPSWSRRRFVQTVAGAAAVGAALHVGLGRPGMLLADGSVPPVPIPGGSPVIAQLAGQLFHVYGPGAPEVDPPDAEPSTITDFSGDVALAFIDGTVQRTNTATGAVRELPFIGSDMRFMAGVYRGTDGQLHRGAFAFI